MPQGVVRMSTTVLQVELPWHDAHTFDLVGQNFRYSFVAESAQDYHSWLAALKRFAASFARGAQALEKLDKAPTENEEKPEGEDNGELLASLVDKTQLHDS